jgi:hypothetical protein
MQTARGWFGDITAVIPSPRSAIQISKSTGKPFLIVRLGPILASISQNRSGFLVHFPFPTKGKGMILPDAEAVCGWLEQLQQEALAHGVPPVIGVCPAHSPRPNPRFMRYPMEAFVHGTVKLGFPLTANPEISEHMFVTVMKIDTVEGELQLVGFVNSEPVQDVGYQYEDWVAFKQNEIEALLEEGPIRAAFDVRYRLYAADMLISSRASNPEHEEFAPILELGDPIISFLLEEVAAESSVTAMGLLSHAAGDRSPPVPLQSQGVVDEMRNTWLQWGLKNGFIPIEAIISLSR